MMQTIGIRSYRDLKVWSKGMEFAELVYGIAKQMPREERYGLTSQMLRSAASVPANVAEGYQRGSLAETETHLLLAARVGLLSADVIAPALACADELSRMLRALRARLIPTERPRHEP